MRRLYATRVDTRIPCPFVYIRLNMTALFGDPVWCIKDVTDDHAIIFLVTATASGYDVFKRGYSDMANWIEFDYFNFNKIEE